MLTARFRLLALWFSQVARTLADNCLRMFVTLQVAQAGLKESDAAWYQVTPFFIAPFILLAPVNGSISNSLPRRWVLVGSAGFCAAVTLMWGVVLGPTGEGWLWCAAFFTVALGAAVYSPTRYAVLPAAAHDCHWPLERVVGLIEMGSAVGTIAGILLGYSLHGVREPPLLSQLGPRGFPAAVAAAVVLNLLGVLTALPVYFPSDVRRPEGPAEAIAGFFRDARRIIREPEARASLAALASFWGILTSGSGAVLAYAMRPEFLDRPETLPQAFGSVSLGAALGSVLAGLQGHPRRGLGLVPLGATGLLGALAWAAATADLGWPCLLLGMMGGLINVPLRSDYQQMTPADAHGNGMAVMNLANYLSATVMAVLMFGIARLPGVTPAGQLALLAALACVGMVIAWRVLLRETLEQIVELVVWPFYRVRVHGPGLEQIPMRGPALVLANHTAWLDPVWVGKVMPRRLTPLMTSRYYDLPIVRWLMVHVVKAIRVPAAVYRREAPELKEAVAALDRGECVMIFPEGFMKRRADQAVRQFGRGVWHILKRRPKTPVVVCWIEGGWGSFTSYYNGLPTKGKPLDWWRRIEIAIHPPEALGKQLLASQRATRSYLMQRCLETRRYLGLEPLQLEPGSNEDVNDHEAPGEPEA